MSDEEYFADRFDISEAGCWEWTGHRNGDGYGIFIRRGKSRYAHRVAYELLVGPIPRGLTIDHLCRNRCCVNPDHLEPVTLKENILRSPDTWGGRHIRKTHCPKGHPLSGDNLVKSTRPGRACRTCNNAQIKERKERQRRETGRVERAKFCKNGHERTPENTYVSPSGHRKCRDCLRAKYLKPGGYMDPDRERPSHCPHGHEFTPENTYVSPDGRTRYCRECNRAAARRR